jgi:SPP1 family predicted phage head-tail adaptor
MGELRLMEAGKLRHRITIQSLTEAKNELAETEETPASVVTLWASVEPLSGRELFLVQQYSSEITHRVRIRYYPGLTPRHQIVFGSRTFNIISIINKEERNIELELLCKESLVRAAT